MLKKITLLLSAFGIIILGGCGKNDFDGQIILREALGNSFTVESSASDANIKIEVQNVEDTSGTVKINMNGKTEDALTFPPKIDYSINLDFDTQNADENMSDSIDLAFKLLENAFFAKVGKPQIDNPKLAAMTAPFAEFTGKWWRFSLEDFLGVEESEISELTTNQLENYKKLLTENDIFLVENLSEDDENYILTVAPNFDLILSRDFIENEIFPVYESLQMAENYIENPELTPEQKIEAHDDLEIDDAEAEQIAETQETAKNIWTLGNFEIILKINKNDNFIHSFEMSGEINLAEFSEIFGEEGKAGKIIFEINSTSSEINQPQNIVPPENFIDFDPAMIFGAMMPPTMSLEPPVGLDDLDQIQGEKKDAKGKCGDGICDDFEKSKGLCPSDCIKDLDAVSRPR